EGVARSGRVGSGKARMANVMGRRDRPSAGHVVIDGFNIAELSDRELSALRAARIGFAFQHFHLAPGVSALDNVADGLLYAGTGVRERRERAEAALRRVGLAHRLTHRPHELSGGQKQPPAIPPAFLRKPALLLADAPTGALDSHSGEGVMRVLLDLNQTGTTIVVITHERVVASYMSRHVSMLDGHVVDDRTGIAP